MASKKKPTKKKPQPRKKDSFNVEEPTAPVAEVVPSAPEEAEATTPPSRDEATPKEPMPESPAEEPAPEPSTASQPSPAVPSVRDPRLPPVGTEITRQYKGHNFTVTVLEDGFLHEGQRYGSLSGVAKALTGQSVNGMVWWGLGYKDGRRPSTGRSVLERKIDKLERLTARMRTALEKGGLALQEAEAELVSLQEKAKQLTPKAD